MSSHLVTAIGLAHVGVAPAIKRIPRTSIVGLQQIIASPAD
jgi:hypothetical protein